MDKKLELHLMDYQQGLRLKSENGKRFIYGQIRKKWLVLQPEELIRQLVLQFLLEKGYSKNRIAVEKGLKVNSLSKRCDILLYDQSTSPYLLVECKAPQVKITQAAFRQIAWYNMPLKVPYLLVTNGMNSFCCQIDFTTESFSFLGEVPSFQES